MSDGLLQGRVVSAACPPGDVWKAKACETYPSTPRRGSAVI